MNDIHAAFLYRISISRMKFVHSDLSLLRFRLKLDIFTFTTLGLRLGLRGLSIFDSAIILSKNGRTFFFLFPVVMLMSAAHSMIRSTVYRKLINKGSPPSTSVASLIKDLIRLYAVNIEYSSCSTKSLRLLRKIVGICPLRVAH